ncbi:MAG: Gfo/Idh/MocA family oxidoreductase [Gemmatimonadales bacterium]
MRRRLRLCAVGCGRAFRLFHSPAIVRSRRWELAAACDPVPDRLQVARHRHPGVRCYASFDDVPDDLPLDAALIATPPGSHAPLAGAAMARDLAVLIEKPMTLGADDARRLVSTARSSGVVVRIGFNRRFRRNCVELRDSVARLPSTALEDLRYVWLADAARWYPTQDTGVEVGDPESLLHDLGSHQVDLFAWLTGRRIVEIEARTPQGGEHSGSLIEYRATLDGGLSASGVVGCGKRYRERVRVLAGNRVFSASPGGFLSASARLTGQLDLAERALTIGHLGWSRLRGRPSMTAESFSRQLDSLADAVIGAPTPGAATEADGLQAVLAVEACLRSMKSGRAEVVAG